MAEDKKTAFIDVEASLSEGTHRQILLSVKDHDGEELNMGDMLAGGMRPILRLRLQRGTWPLREAGLSIQSLRTSLENGEGGGFVLVDKQALEETLGAFKYVLQAIDDRAAIMFDGENVAFAEVLRVSSAMADDPTIPASDKNAVRAFVTRFADRAAMAVPTTSKKA